MIFRHYRNWMPNLRRGHGRALVSALDEKAQNSTRIGPEIGPERSPGTRKPRIVKGLGLWRRGESNPRPKVIRQSFSVRSLVF
jgi:hypothetical protein